MPYIYSYNDEDEDFFEDDNRYDDLFDHDEYDYDDEEDYNYDIDEINTKDDVISLVDRINYVYTYKYNEAEKDYEYRYGSCSSLDFCHDALTALARAAINKPELANDVINSFTQLDIPFFYITYDLLNILKNRPDLIDNTFQTYAHTNIINDTLLFNITELKPELADKYIEIFNTNDSTYFHIEYLYKLFKIKPQLIDKILHKYHNVIDSNKRIDGSFYSSLSNILLDSPEYSNKIFHIYTKAIKHGNDFDMSYTLYKSLYDICKNNPEFTPQVLDIYKEAVKSDNNNDYSLKRAYECLSEIAKDNPKYSSQIIDTFKEAVKSDKNTATTLLVCYRTLSDMVQNNYEKNQSNQDSLDIYLLNDNAKINKLNTELAKQVLDVLTEGVKSDCNDYYCNEKIFNILYNIIIKKPELANQAFEIFNTALKSNNFSRLETSNILSQIAKNKPELANQVLKAYSILLASDKNNEYNLDYIYDYLSEIAKNKPELTLHVVDIYKENIKSGKYRFYAYTVLSDIVKDKREFTQQILDIIKETLKSDIKYASSIRSTYSFLSEIVNNKPEFAKQVFDIIKNDFPSVDKTISKYQYFILSKCMRGNDAKQFVEKATKHKSDLTACYNMRFSTKEECFYLLENYNISQIAQINMSAQHRCMNVLMSQLANELKLDKAIILNYRANSQDATYSNNADWLIPASVKASQIFGCWFPSYIKQTQGYLSTHDSVYWLPEDMGSKKNESFVSFVQRNLIYNANGETKVRPLNEMEIIANAWKDLLPNEEKLKYKDILAICKSKKYKDAEHCSFSIEAGKWGIEEGEYKYFEDIYSAGLDVPEPFDSSKEFKFGKYRGRFLPRDDVRTGFFGMYTNCCQHFKGVGRECAISSVKDPYSQLFVIEDEEGKIIAGSWVWENKEETYRDVCFDNIEAIGEYKKHPMINKIYHMAGRYLTEEANCRKVTIGIGYQDAETHQYAPTTSIALPKQYGNKYSDAKKQVLLYENPNAVPLDKNAESMRFIRKSCFLDSSAMDKISEQCFPESDQILQSPDRLTGLVLVDENKGVVGYCLYDKKEKSIYDMAVLPEYRTDNNASSTKLFAALFKEIKEIGGTWVAELRENTTYRYIETMQKRGLVSFETTGIDHIMSDGSKVYSVSFKINDLQKTNSLSMQSGKKIHIDK